LDVSSDDIEQNIVVDVVEAPFDVAFDEPDSSCPFAVDFPQSCMTTSLRTESM
jgi:hypothetical protein